MGKKTQAVLDLVSDVMVDVNQSCIASAVSSAIVDIKGANKVVISGLNMTSDITTKASCQQEKDIQIGPMQDTLRAKLQAKMTASNSNTEADTARLVTRISEAINVEVVSSCNAMAINDLKIEIANVKGTVTIENLNITQKANATINKCIQKDTVRVGSVPLKKYIEDNEDQFDIEDGAVTAQTTQTANTDNKTTIVAAIFFVLALYLIGLALGTTKYLKVW